MIHKSECGGQWGADCRLQIVPSKWAQLPYDSKRDIVAGIGKALNVLHSAAHTNFVDANSGKDLAVYLARSHTVDIE
ncbi:MAG: hypothetical protein ICV87_06815 [Gemmatimonadetes bacterium]|nr:hypothetical protein [Gemmatimonadota bacterium]